MIVYFNNKAMKVKNEINVDDVLSLYEGKEHMAVWLNGNHLTLSEFKETVLTSNDRLKVVRIRGGG